MSKKKNLLMDIVTSDQLTIELVFGKAAWEKFLELQPDDEIAVVGNGPVRSYHGEIHRKRQDGYAVQPLSRAN